MIEQFKLNIKLLSDETKEYNFNSDPSNFSISEIKKLIFPSHLSSSVRLIYQGRLLNDTDLFKDYSIPNAAFLHAAFSNNIEMVQMPLLSSPNQDSLINIPSTRRGFERLLDQSYTDDEIEKLREIYHVGYLIDNYSMIRSNMIEKEENLMNTDRNNIILKIDQIRNEIKIEENGDWSHLIWGIILGYFFNVIMLVLISFCKGTKKAILGSLCGFIFKVIVICIKNWNNKDFI